MASSNDSTAPQGSGQPLSFGQFLSSISQHNVANQVASDAHGGERSDNSDMFRQFTFGPAPPRSDAASSIPSSAGHVTRRTSSRLGAPVTSFLPPARPSTSLSCTRTSTNMPSSATNSAVPSSSELKNLISEQSAALLRELRHQIAELRSTMDHERQVGHKEILAESTTQLELQLAKMREELRGEQKTPKEALLSKLMEDVKSSVATSNQQLTTKFDSTLNARLKAIVDKVDELRTEFEDFEDVYDGVPDLLLKLAQSYAKNHNNLAAAEKRLSGRLDVLETGTTAQGAPQLVQDGAETSAPRAIDHRYEEQAATSKAMDQQQSIALIQAATTAAASLGGQAKITLSTSANSFAFSINNGAAASSDPTTSPPATQRLAHPHSRPIEENDTTMPPAKRPRTEEAGNEHEKGSSRDRSASETLIGDDDEEEGTGQ